MVQRTQKFKHVGLQIMDLFLKCVLLKVFLLLIPQLATTKCISLVSTVTF